jgi:hypothetical protein
MPSDSPSVQIKLRIPGRWRNPGELVHRLPPPYNLTSERFIPPDGTEIEFAPLPADEQFASVFRGACRSAAEPEELAAVDAYTVNYCLMGPGGSLDAARAMMRAGAAVVAAGGAGVFIDNCALAHGGRNWADMAEDGGPDALSFAFVNVVGGRQEAYTMGMHVLGLPEIVMKSQDARQDDFGIIDVVRYVCASEKPVGDGHILMDLEGPRFKTIALPPGEQYKGSPMHNPYGKLKLVSMRDIAEAN